MAGISYEYINALINPSRDDSCVCLDTAIRIKRGYNRLRLPRGPYCQIVEPAIWNCGYIQRVNRRAAAVKGTARTLRQIKLTCLPCNELRTTKRAICNASIHYAARRDWNEPHTKRWRLPIGVYDKDKAGSQEEFAHYSRLQAAHRDTMFPS